MKELSEKSEVLQQEEQQRKSWEIKAAASEKRIEQLQVRPANPLPSQKWVAEGQGIHALGQGKGWEGGECPVGLGRKLPGRIPNCSRPP